MKWLCVGLQVLSMLASVVASWSGMMDHALWFLIFACLMRYEAEH